MSTKQIIISSLGLQNIILNKYQDEEDFFFVFGDQQFRMKSFFAEFISPIVSHLHQTDPTINTINFGELNPNNYNKFNELSKIILTKETISLIFQISSGFSIEINEEQAIKLRFLSILLGNEELHSKLNELFPQNFTEKNVNSYLKNIECCYYFSCIKQDFDFSNILSFIASNFYLLDQEEFLNQSRRLQYLVISHPQLRIESEDSLFDIIIKIIESSKENEEIDDSLFLEQIEFTGLSEHKFQIFIDIFNINDINGELWKKLSKCFFTKFGNKSGRTIEKFKGKIIVAGNDQFNQLGKAPNNENDEGFTIISPQVKSSFESSSLLSFSTFSSHSVLITKNSSLQGIGDNSVCRISSSLTKAEIRELTEFSINDENGHQLTPISAVCCGDGTFYMLSKSDNGDQKLIALCHGRIKNGDPIFLDIGDKQPVSLFGGCLHGAAISNEGEVIFINIHSVNKSPDSRIEAISLPDSRIEAVRLGKNLYQ